MVDMKKYGSRRTRLALGAAALLGLGVAGGAGAVSLTRPSVEMAPTVATPIAKLAATQGVVTVKGRVAEVYGDRFVVQDGTGRAMVSAGRDATIATGSAVTVQGRYDDGQLRASYLVDPQGRVEQVGPGRGPGGRHGPEGGPGGPGRDGPPPPPPPGGPAGPGGPGAGAGAPPPPPPGGCGPAGAPGVGTPPPPPPAAGAGAPPPPVTGAPNSAAPR